jgi:hypothetical protein
VSSGVRLELRAVGGLELLVLGIGLELRADEFDFAQGGGFFTGVAVTRVIAGAAREQAPSYLSMMLQLSTDLSLSMHETC